MTWFLVDKSKTNQPPGNYRQWKPILRVEGRYQCVYCSIGEGAFGGFRNFHVEHYRPKKYFPDLEDVIANLFYACGICNSFKGSDWPGEPREDNEVAAYPDPSKVNLATIFSVDGSGLVQSNCISGRYVIERLFLNRPQLLIQRRIDAVIDELGQMREELGSLIGESMPGAVGVVILEMTEMLERLRSIPPYEPNDVARAA